jgi:Ni,Fe-hydrogenase maturation factor
LVDALRFLQPDRVSPRVTVLGVEPATLEFGLELSPKIRAALPQAVALAHETVAQWRRASVPQDLPAALPEPALA